MLLQEAAGYKLRVENEAQGNASRFNQIYTQYLRAPEVTRQRLYLDAQEQIMTSVSKVIIDQKAGNSLIYLPLDKLLAETTKDTSLNNQASSVQYSAPTVEVHTDMQRANENLRSRDKR
jgi:membrane protease subunit HflK